MSQLNKLYRNFIILQEDERGYSISNDKTLSGYSKIEAKGEKCKISFYAQNLRSDSDDYCVLAVCSKKDTKQLVNLGKLTISDGGKAEVIKEYFLDDIGGIGLSFDKVTGAAIAKMRNDIPLIVMCGFINGEQPTDNWKNYKVVNTSNDKLKEKIEYIKRDEKKKDKKDKEKIVSKGKEKNDDKMKYVHKKEEDNSCENDNNMNYMHKTEEDNNSKNGNNMGHMNKKEEDNCSKNDDNMKHMYKKEEDNCNENKDKMDYMHKKEEDNYNENENKMNHTHKKESNIDECMCGKNQWDENGNKLNPFNEKINSKNPFGDYETNTRFSRKSNKFDDYENKIEELSGNFKIRGSVGEYFEGIANGFEVLSNEYREIKNCKWYRVPVKDLDDLCNVTNYNRYTVAYYPMLNYYPYIRKHGYFNLGFKCDRDGNLKYIVYGIPGNRSLDEQPYEGKTGFVTWINRENRNGMGSWLMFYDFRNSTVVVPME